jgi:P4 family phage/plasmid primase-like protien
LKFLTEIFEGDQELIDWIQRYCGYLLTGSVKEQILFFGFGLGANGKTVFAELLKYIMGDYSRTITPETISETRRTAGGASPDIANLAGARLVVGSETEEGQALNESLVKQLTGGEKIVARNLYESQFEFTPQFKLMILGNHKPFIRGNDYGIWRRILLVPFLKTFDKNERDPDLLDTLKSEAPDILAWMIRGHQLWNEEGLSKIPDAIVNASSEYRQEVDYLGQWLQECCLVEDGAETAKTVAYNSYRCWAVECGLKPLTSQSFGRRMKEKGISESRTSAARVWIGVKINTSGLFSEINQEEGLN